MIIMLYLLIIAVPIIIGFTLAHFSAKNDKQDNLNYTSLPLQGQTKSSSLREDNNEKQKKT